MSSYDVIVIGSSPNALVAAALLGKAGKRTLVLEERQNLGGPLQTEMFAPGFRADTVMMSCRLDPEIASELGLSPNVLTRSSITSLGSEIVTRSSPLPLPPAVSDAVSVLRALYHDPLPPHPVSHEPVFNDRAPPPFRAALAEWLRGSPRAAFEVLRLPFLSARDYANELSLNEVDAGFLCGAAVRALSEGPFAPGTLFSFLHHEAVFDGLFRSTARGGLSSLIHALAERAETFGVEIRKGAAGPLRLEIEDGLATGVLFSSGEPLRATTFVSDLDAHHTFTQLVAPYHLDPEVNRAVHNVRSKGTVARVHLALRDHPTFACVDESAYDGTFVIGGQVTAIEKAWDCAKRGTLSHAPYIEFVVPTASDPSLVDQPGKHVLTAWVQYVPPGVTAESVRSVVVENLKRFAPAIESLIEHAQVVLPSDIETHVGLYGGHLYGAEGTLAQTLFARPFPGCSLEESPIKNLLLSGSSTHPGGYSGRSGHHVAHRLLNR